MLDANVGVKVPELIVRLLNVASAIWVVEMYFPREVFGAPAVESPAEPVFTDNFKNGLSGYFGNFSYFFF